VNKRSYVLAALHHKGVNKRKNILVVLHLKCVNKRTKSSSNASA